MNSDEAAMAALARIEERLGRIEALVNRLPTIQRGLEEMHNDTERLLCRIEQKQGE
jgi:hypothetical protein